MLDAVTVFHVQEEVVLRWSVTHPPCISILTMYQGQRDNRLKGFHVSTIKNIKPTHAQARDAGRGTSCGATARVQAYEEYETNSDADLDVQLCKIFWYFFGASQIHRYFFGADFVEQSSLASEEQ
ncbi:unnamed protein product [Strongylus vulgaris]|uniref:Uncharacterized protein n=1 Tax=Strongylus vulgaris TaxID=40348 RepID=A0A3P7JEY1_STRVU|nr:unnamed protein product [Strongylus vulgaris]